MSNDRLREIMEQTTRDLSGLVRSAGLYVCPVCGRRTDEWACAGWGLYSPPHRRVMTRRSP